jgi:polyisoprenoid-binding protein YceI
MRRTLAFVSMIATLLASATAGRAADYTIDPTHSHILFTIDHLGFAKMVGLFADFSGTISFDANNVPASKLNVTIKTDSLQTQFAPRDKDLKGADWFNVTEFPEMTFVGTDFAKKDDHTEMISRTPLSPRSLRCLRNALQPALSSLAPSQMPRISR